MKKHKIHKTHRIQKVGYGTSDIAVMCRVTPATVAKWIDDGKISSYLTAGGHRRVGEKDLAPFMARLKIPIPHELQNNTVPHILIVDDDPQDRELMIHYIRQCLPKVKIHQASKGFDVGHKLATYRPVIMLLDIRLPGMDGFEVCETIRKDHSLDDVKILAVSGQDDDETKRRIIRAGADGFLSKNSPEEIRMKKIQEIFSLSGIYVPGKN